MKLTNFCFKVIITALQLSVVINVGNAFFFKQSHPRCPPAELFSPCECYLHAESMKIIRCGGDKVYDLAPIFSSLSAYLQSRDDKHFHMFYLNNTAMGSLGNVFHDITFDYIYFDGARNLQAIHPNAFDITGPYVKEMRAFDTQLKHSSLEDSIKGLSSLQHLTVSNVALCPPEELITPCQCVYRSDEWQWVSAKFTRIICGEKSEEDLNAFYKQHANRSEEQLGYYAMRRLQIYFQRLSESLNRINWQKRFDEFVLQHSPITELPRNVFNDIIFYAIHIDNCPKLSAIHPTSFTMTEPFVQELLVRRTKLANERWKLRDTFSAITSLTNLRVLYLHWSGLQTIPHHAFRPLKGKFQRKLVKVSIKYQDSRNHSLRTVGSYAFYYLPNLKTLDLSINTIVKVYRNAFSLRWPSNEVLEINLAGNNLSDTSIDPAAFSEAQRPVHVVLGQGNLGNPNLYHLDESVFRLFLKENSKNRVIMHSSQNNKKGNRIMCDCHSRWLFDNVGRLRHGVEDVMCIANTSWECLPPCLVFGKEMIQCGSNQEFNISSAFYTLSKSLLPHEHHVNTFVLSNTQIETIPAYAFANISFGHLILDGCNKLYEIDDQAFVGTSEYIKKITILKTSVFSRSKWRQFSISQFPNITHVELSFEGEFRLFNDTFKSNKESNSTLFVRINQNNVRDDSIAQNAFNDAKRPIQLFLDSYQDVFDANNCNVIQLEESIYAPLLANNPQNQIHVMWCPIMCDCSVKWLFDAPKDWWRRVDTGDSSLLCHDQRYLYFYSQNEFRSCPKTNLLKYFVKDNTTKISQQSLQTSTTGAIQYLINGWLYPNPIETNATETVTQLYTTQSKIELSSSESIPLMNRSESSSVTAETTSQVKVSMANVTNKPNERVENITQLTVTISNGKSILDNQTNTTPQELIVDNEQRTVAPKQEVDSKLNDALNGKEISSGDEVKKSQNVSTERQIKSINKLDANKGNEINFSTQKFDSTTEDFTVTNYETYSKGLQTETKVKEKELTTEQQFIETLSVNNDYYTPDYAKDMNETYITTSTQSPNLVVTIQDERDSRELSENSESDVRVNQNAVQNLYSLTTERSIDNSNEINYKTTANQEVKDKLTSIALETDMKLKDESNKVDLRLNTMTTQIENGMITTEDPQIGITTAVNTVMKRNSAANRYERKLDKTYEISTQNEQMTVVNGRTTTNDVDSTYVDPTDNIDYLTLDFKTTKRP